MSVDERPRGWDLKDPPRWARRLVWQTLIVIGAALTLLALIRTLRGLILWLVYALFLSLALEPAVDWLQKRGWPRGLSAILLLATLGLAFVGMLLMVIPLLIEAIGLIVRELPTWTASLDDLTQRCCDVTVDAAAIRNALESADVSLASVSGDALAVLTGGVGNLLGGVASSFTVGLFAYYLVAQAPQVRRSMLSLLPERRQEEVLYVWETAIEKMGGYLYSRMALALINGGLFFVLLKIVGVPFALPLALFEGFVAAFIPIIGTYIAVIVPALVAVITGPRYAALAIVGYSLVYQAAENYWLSPKISAKTMALHPAVALGAGIAGGAIGGLLWAFVALPVAATIQAAIGAYVERHDVIESELTREREVPERERRAWRDRFGRGRRVRPDDRSGE